MKLNAMPWPRNMADAHKRAVRRPRERLARARQREPDFQALRTRLLQGGVAPRHVRRTLRELKDHYHDLVDETIASGVPHEAERDSAARRLGALDDVVTGLLACRELRTWPYRYPRLAVLVYPLACLLALPAVPVLVGVAKAPLLARWGASLLLAGLVTAAMMLILQLSISFG